MGILMKSILVALFFMCAPVFGYLSWLFCQDGNWIITYILSICSAMGVLCGWHLLERDEPEKIKLPNKLRKL